MTSVGVGSYTLRSISSVRFRVAVGAGFEVFFQARHCGILVDAFHLGLGALHGLVLSS
jgi:hypothetical protein